ncbi:MAG: ABC transporter ATP-binding protein, partial [Proteobacteria bacterium]|nr:ABC transporter ATP-binding protein [Pseudomonadota bacterium]
LDRPSRGLLVIDGEDTAALDDTALTRLRGERIGFVFQHHHLIPAFTAEENVAMPLLIARGRPDAAMFARAGELLARVGLGERRHHAANRLSGGQQQRVAIARALAMSPSLVLADEPTGNLDTHSADEVFALLREVNVQLGTSFLIVTHDPRLAGRCDRIIELVDGAIVSDRPNRAGADLRGE